MFTGIVQETGVVSSQENNGEILRFALLCSPHFAEGIQLGASVSISGVCLTLVETQKNQIWFEAIPETLAKTTLKHLRLGSKFNLERSAKIGDEIGGHLLSGHIYGTGTVANITANIYSIECPHTWMKYFFSKGYIAIDGVSLTLVDVNREKGFFTVHLIPETLKRTTLSDKKVGDAVNIELDSMTQAVVETVERTLQK